MYPLVLTLHGIVRWAVVAAACVCVFRFAFALLHRRAWNATDERATIVLIGAADVQLSLGLLLWLFVSPFGPGRGAVMPFFTFVHPICMIVAVTTIHVGRARAQRQPETQRHAAMLASLLVAGLLFALIVPWPWTTWARPLFRMGGA